jgi:nucleolar protein 53
MAAPATHKQPSRKGKKAWRKNVDLTEVQSGLDTVRDEVIAGGVIKEKGSDELFATDTTGDAEIAKKAQGGKKLLKAEEILALRSAVPGLDGRKRKAEDRIVPSSSKRVKNGTYVPHKELQRLKNVADGANGGVLVDENAALHDPWAQTVTTKDPRLDFLDEAKPKKEPRTLKEAPISLAANGKRVQAVSKPHAGKSYNPLVGDWSALVEREGAAAVSAEQERLISKAEADAKAARAEEEAAKVVAQEREQYATDYDSAWESEWDGFQSENDHQVWTQKQNGRKTPAERNKVKARKERERAELHERKMKQRDAQEKKISQIAKEVSAKDKARRAHSKALQTTSNDSDADSDDGGDLQLQRRRFGKLAVPQAPLEVVLPDELEDSLRRLKPEGNLMQERYRNLLVSGKMEVRRKQWQRRQAKKTVSEKWSYKDWKLR